MSMTLHGGSGKVALLVVVVLLLLLLVVVVVVVIRDSGSSSGSSSTIIVLLFVLKVPIGHYPHRIPYGINLHKAIMVLL